MYPPPVTKPPGPHGSVVVTLRDDVYEEVLDFYSAAFGALGVTPMTINEDDEPRTTLFADALCIRDEQPGSANADVILYVSSEDEIRAVLKAVHSHVEPEGVGGDGEPARYQAVTPAPGGNSLWLVYDVPADA